MTDEPTGDPSHALITNLTAKSVAMRLIAGAIISIVALVIVRSVGVGFPTGGLIAGCVTSLIMLSYEVAMIAWKIDQIDSRLHFLPHDRARKSKHGAVKE